jgi:hypothetical protein
LWIGTDGGLFTYNLATDKFLKSTADRPFQLHFPVSVLFACTSISRTDFGSVQTVAVVAFMYRHRTPSKLIRNKTALQAMLYKVFRVTHREIFGSARIKDCPSSMFQKRILQIMIPGTGLLPMSLIRFRP